MTPEEARALEPDTAGPWTVTPMGAVLGPDGTPLVRNSDGNMYRADAELAAAAPDMRDTIAALEWEWGVQGDAGTGPFRLPIEEETDPDRPYWTPDRVLAQRTLDNAARLNIHIRYRLVRRPVGPVEVVEL